MVLLVGDEWLYRSIESVVGARGMQVLHASGATAAVDAIRQSPVDVVLVVHDPPIVDAIATCRRLTAVRGDRSPLPIVVIADHPDRALRASAFSTGAWQILTPPLDGEILVAQLETFCRVTRVVDRASTEPLLDEEVGVYTIRGLVLRAREIASLAARHAEPIACVVVSLRELRGSDDSAIAQIARTCVGVSRASDAVGWVGDRDVGILAAGTDAAGSERLATRVRAALRNRPGLTTAGIGFSVAPPSSGPDPMALIARALLAARRECDGLAFGDTASERPTA